MDLALISLPHKWSTKSIPQPVASDCTPVPNSSSIIFHPSLELYLIPVSAISHHRARTRCCRLSLLPGFLPHLFILPLPLLSHFPLLFCLHEGNRILLCFPHDRCLTSHVTPCTVVVNRVFLLTIRVLSEV